MGQVITIDNNINHNTFFFDTYYKYLQLGRSKFAMTYINIQQFS